MNLSNYLQNTNQTVAIFAEKTGISEPSIYKYLSGDRSPRKKHIQIIFKHSNGQVTANDFYKIPAIKSSKQPLQLPASPS